jgi:hypothetical protein
MYISEGPLSGATLSVLEKTEIEKRYYKNINNGYDHKTSLSMSLRDYVWDAGVRQPAAMETS